MKRYLAILLMPLVVGTSHAADNEKSASAIIEPDMVRIAPGSFYMGSDENTTEKPPHQISIAYPFEIGRTEITQGQWKAVMGSNPSSFSACGDRCPVENVSWLDVNRFIALLNQKTGKTYRLPSEAEWEYACRAGRNYKYCGSDDNPFQIAWHQSNSLKAPHPVAQKLPNAWGLYDMSGNVWEWVQDCWSDNYQEAAADGSAREANNCRKRAIRGGSWDSEPASLRAANRFFDNIGYKLEYVGFRVARTLPSQ